MSAAAQVHSDPPCCTSGLQMHLTPGQTDLQSKPCALSLLCLPNRPLVSGPSAGACEKDCRSSQPLLKAIAHVHDVPIFRCNSNSCNMAMPIFAFSLRLSQNISHDLLARALSSQAVLRPTGEILEVEWQVVLHSTHNTKFALQIQDRQVTLGNNTPQCTVSVK